MWRPIRNLVLALLVAVAAAPAGAQTSADDLAARTTDTLYRLAHLFAPPAQSITIPNTFVNGTVADATQVNANFTALSSNALNRNGGTMLGTLNSRALTPTSDATYDLATNVLRYRDGWFSRNGSFGGTLAVTGAATFSSTVGVNGLTYTFPASQAATTCLQNNGSGTLSWAACAPATIAATTSTGTQNDFAAGLTFVAGQVATLRANNATLLTLTGVAGGVDGAYLRIVSIGAGQVDLAHQNASSTAANRLLNFATSGSTSLAAGVGEALFVYDGTTARWRLVQHEQGAWITATFAAGNFTASAGTWTLASGDQTTLAYYLKGRDLTVAFTLVTTTTSTTPNALNIGNAGWGSFTAAKQVWAVGDARDTGGSAFGPEKITVDVSAAGTTIRLRRGNWSGTNWVAATDTTDANGLIVFEVQ